MATQGGNKLCLGGLSALQCCRLDCQKSGRDEYAVLHLDETSLDSQRHSLQELTLRGINNNIRVANIGWYLIALPALRFLTIQNLGVADLMWMQSSWFSQPAGPVHSLDLDDNTTLQLNAEAAAAILNLTALKQLSMRKSPAPSDGSGVADQAEPAALRASVVG